MAIPPTPATPALLPEQSANHDTLCFAAAALLVFLLGVPCSVRAQVAPLTTVREVRALTPEQAREGRPVMLRGVVTTLSGWKNSLFVQDGTAGISIDRDDASPALTQGQEVEVRGTTTAGLFAPTIAARSISVKGVAPLPPTRVFTLNELSGGGEDSQWLAVRGIIRSAEVKPMWGRALLVLSIDIENGTLITARVLNFNPAGVHQLVASAVLVRGVCGTVFNDRRQFVGLRLFVSSLKDVRIERPAPAEPFQVPTRNLGELLQFSHGKLTTDPVKISATVTWSKPNEGLYVQEGSQGIFVQSGDASALPPGSRIEAVGYPVAGRYSPKLENAVFRSTGTVSSIAPIEGLADDMIVIKDGFASVPYDALLVKVKGRLIEEVPGAEEDQLLLQDGKTFFTARLARSAFGRMELRKGSILGITGICVAAADRAHEANNFSILLRSSADIVVVRAPPWWTATHAAWAVGLLAFVVFAVLAWIAFLRHQAELRAMALTDPLTELYNRRGFELLAQQQWLVAQRSGVPLLLFYIDLDHFKQINDSFGHREGDAALQSLADKLRDSFRKTDVIGRLGGDEFAVVAIDGAVNTPEALENRLLDSVRELNEKKRHPFTIGLSLGVLCCDASMSGKSIEELLSQADVLMYERKRKQQSERKLDVSARPIQRAAV